MHHLFGMFINASYVCAIKIKCMTKAQQMLEFIEQQIENGCTIHISTPLRTTAITPKTHKKFKSAGHTLLKIDTEGNLRLASGKNFNIICYPEISLVQVKAIN